MGADLQSMKFVSFFFCSFLGSGLESLETNERGERKMWAPCGLLGEGEG